MVTSGSMETAHAEQNSLESANLPCDVQLGTGQLAAHAMQLAERLQVVLNAPDRTKSLRARFERDVDVIEQAYQLSLDAVANDQSYSAVADWLLDNFYVVREQIRDIREHMPPSFFRELPKLADGEPRVHAIAHELVGHCDCALDEELILHFVDQFQTDIELMIGETWAVPAMLRIALVEKLHGICQQLIEETESIRCVDALLTNLLTDRQFELPSQRHEWSPTLIAALYESLDQRHDVPKEVRATLDRHFQSMEWHVAELRKREQHRLAANQVSMGNIITSMRLLGSLDWVRFFEHSNRCERILRRDPSDVYAAMDFASRNRYRDAVEQLAKRSVLSETDVARKALELAADNCHTDANRLETYPTRHIGYWLVDEGRRELEQQINFRPGVVGGVKRWAARHTASVYFGAIAVLFTATLCALVVLSTTLQVPWSVIITIALLAALPISELAQTLVNAIATRVAKVRLLPKLEFRDGVSRSFPTMVVVPSMLTSQRQAMALLEKLENHYLTNSEANVAFALLTDFADADEQATDTDAEILQVAVDGIRQLNARYATDERSPFYLFHRERRWNAGENRWMGWERKRGKLMEFGELLRGNENTSYIVKEGDCDRLGEFRHAEHTPFVITLDSDTILPRGAARKLVGTLAHPLNRPVTEPANGSHRVVRGYTILQPRVSIHFADTPSTRYLQTHAMDPGIDPYVSAASDVYQDLFAEGSFTGKGIYDLRAFEQTLSGVFPENRILSHDLIEGCHGRVALASDIEVFDGYPTRYDADSKRMHRWVRGDWQISPWLARSVPSSTGRTANRLTGLSRWKLFDNMRRSLVAPSLLAFLLVGWIFAPQQAWTWTHAAAAVVFFPVLIQAVTGLLGWMSKFDRTEKQFHHYARTLGNSAERAFYAAMLLPHKAVQMSDAVFRTLYRLLVSRQRMLEWETSAATESRLGKNKWSIASQLLVCSVVAAVAFLLVDEQGRFGALPWLTIWLVAPIVGQLISLPRKEKVERLQSQDKAWLMQIASGTWGFFERYVNASGNWLPPDNVQDYPREKIATRISPSNEGLFLVSGLVARRYGFAGIHALVDLWEKNLANWTSLEQLHGHHYNWYETDRLRPLHPFYVSTVDSGNLAACYLTLIEGIRDLIQQPLVSQSLANGLRSSLNWLREQIGVADLPHDEWNKAAAMQREQLSTLDQLAKELSDSLELDDETFTGISVFSQRLNSAANQLNGWVESQPDNLKISRIVSQTSIVAERFAAIYLDIKQLMPWRETFAKMESKSTADGESQSALLWTISPKISLREMSQLTSLLDSLTDDHLNGNPRLRELATQSTQAASHLIKRLHAIRERCNAATQGMDFRFLYNARRKLFSIGFNADIGTLDRGHYDLLCSECRIASYLAIAKGDVETEHWFRLGRQATRINGRYSLLSWGGTMFEFLMPQLFLRSYEGSLIDTSCQTAIARQIEYGRQCSVPWGISESAFSALNSNSDFQYKSFGVPGLGLKRDLSKDLVVSPYSTALSLPFLPDDAMQNLRRLAEVALGNWGFYDAVDFTTRRLRRKKSSNLVTNYMAHHQGMTLLAMANATDEHLVTKWFHSHPMIRANELLLQERVPAFVDSHIPNPDEYKPTKVAREETTSVCRQIVGVHAASPRTLLLSNGQFTSMLSHTGGGYTQHNDTQVTRWRSDPTLDQWGSFLYLRDCNTQEVWSAAYQPTRVSADHYEAIFAVDKGEIHRRQGDIETNLEVVVSPEHNAEVRQLRITNHGVKPRTIEVTSYAEVALSSQAADIAHPAFQKLFVETEYIADHATLIARRRPRDAAQAPLFAIHTLAVPGEFSDSVEYESSREAFLGRGRTSRSPLAIQRESLTNSSGAVLDPVFALRCAVTIEPSAAVTLGVTTAVAPNRLQALAMADMFHDMRGVQRAIELAWALTQIELRQSNLSARQVHLFQQLGSMVLYPDASWRGDTAQIESNRLGQSSLWHFGISGDAPILLLRVGDSPEIESAKEVIAAHRFLVSRGLRVDLVLVNDHPGVYFDSLHEQLQSLLNEQDANEKAINVQVTLLRGSQLNAEDHRLLDAAASVLLRGDRGTLAQQIELASEKNRTRVDFQTAEMRLPDWNPNLPASIRRNDFPNGFGRFADHGKYYEIDASADHPTPAPWSNVIANPRFGCLITEAGGGYTWSGNSRENKLTTWSNDPVSDPAAEIVYVRSLGTETHWSPLVLLQDGSQQSVKHGPGYSEFWKRQDDVQSQTLVTIHTEKPLKLVRIRLTNHGQRSRQLQVTYYAETVLGVAREQTRLHQVSHFDADHHALLMTNGFHPEFSSQVMFLKMLGGDELAWTADRRSFLGRDGSPQKPLGLSHGLNRQVGAGLDPCLALQGTVSIAPGETKEVVFVLGAGAAQSEAMALLSEFNETVVANEAITEAIGGWNEHLSTLTVETPNRELDVLVNRWLPYQILSCRVWGRSAFYQSGGAFGFRDQLQDVMALVYSRPDIVREHILRAASRQYVEGDVQHWWHPPSGKGTRTRFSDDFLFLPFVTLHYLQATNDREILDEFVPFIESPPLMVDEQERYEQPTVSNERATLLEHCCRAIQHGMRDGQHHLPLMGCGDWNDGMNKVGATGEGESVWVAWFQIVLLDGFADVLRELGDMANASKYTDRAAALRVAIDEHAWDGKWYCRAFFDDGTPLGSHNNSECQIDSLSQSWAAIAGGSNERSRQAFQSAIDRLVRSSEKIIQLFDPPFDATELNPGYIRGYVPGVRENGGQYTHAAIWMVVAATKLGDGESAMRLFDMLNPIFHTNTREQAERYKIEPYVIAADVYTNEQHIGRGGWSWYTGSASWMYRAAIEFILGIRIDGNRLTIKPCVPDDWQGFRVTYRRNQTTWRINATRASAHVPNEVESSDALQLVDDGLEHDVSLTF